MIDDLGAALTVLARAEAVELNFHSDVAAFGAPSECHGLVARESARRLRMARRLAKSIARRPMRVIEKEARERGMPVGSPRWSAFVGHLCVKLHRGN